MSKSKIGITLNTKAITLLAEEEIVVTASINSQTEENKSTKINTKGNKVSANGKLLGLTKIKKITTPRYPNTKRVVFFDNRLRILIIVHYFPWKPDGKSANPNITFVALTVHGYD